MVSQKPNIKSTNMDSILTLVHLDWRLNVSDCRITEYEQRRSIAHFTEDIKIKDLLKHGALKTDE